MKEKDYDRLGLMMVQTMAFASSVGCITLFFIQANKWFLIPSVILSYLFIWSLSK